MKKLILAALLFASPAWAVTRTVISDAQLAQANIDAEPGDIVRIMGKETPYTTLPLPVNVGTAESPIHYVGAISDPDSVKFTGNLSCEVNYVQYRYFRVTGDVTIAPANTAGNHTLNGSIGGVRGIKLKRINCYAGSFYMDNAQWCLVDSSWFGHVPTGNETFRVYTTYDGVRKTLKSSRDTISNCTVYRANATTENSEALVMWGKLIGSDGQDTQEEWDQQTVDSIFIDNNKFTLVNRNGATWSAGYGNMLWLYTIQNGISEDNKYTMVDSSGRTDSNTRRHAYRLRGAVRHMLFRRDTVLASGSKGEFIFSTSSVYGEQPNEETYPRTMLGYNRWDQCFFKNGFDNGEYQPYIFQWGMNADTLTNSVFIANRASEEVAGMIVNSIQDGGGYVRNNTFYSTLAYPPFSMTPAGEWGCWSASANLIIMDNIFACGANGTKAAGMRIVYRDGRTMSCDYNLFYVPSDSGKAVYHRLQPCPDYTPCPDPDPALCRQTSMTHSEAGITGSWFQYNNNSDRFSRYGNPQFTNSTFAAFDPTPANSSVALGHSSTGRDIGAIQLDTTRPDDISDLAVVVSDQTSIMFTWTATGDDSLTGTARTYDIRYTTTSTDIDDESEFFGNSSAPGVTGLVPSPAGTTETFTLTGLTSGTIYYIRIKSRDESGNYSAASNTLTIRTKYDFDATEWQ